MGCSAHSLTCIVILVLFQVVYCKVVTQTLVPGVCVINQVLDDTSGNLVAINKTDNCNCKGLIFPTFLFNPGTTNLEQINLQNCNLGGQILNLIDPTNQVLTTIDIEGNQFSESIPTFIPNLKTLLIFDISNNLYYGDANFANTGSILNRFDVAYNQLNGSAGNFILPDLNPSLQFYIAGNKFTVNAQDPIQPPANLPSYMDSSGIKGGAAQLACIYFLKGSTPPTWCNVMGPLCICTPQCGNGYLELNELCETTQTNGVCCNQCTSYSNSSVRCSSNQACVNSFCSGTGLTCSPLLAPKTQICRPNVTVCDVTEYCTGSSTSCPPDTFANTSVVCRGKAGFCDIAEFCPGNNSTCPPDIVANTSVLCHAVNGSCDVAEYCDGMNVACPIDTFQNNQSLCRAANDSCDASEYCTGSSPNCPPNTFQPSSTLCRPASDVCDVDAYCLGNATYCPYNFKPSSTQCRPPVDLCDSPEFCTGLNASCPADTLFNSSHVCRAANGSCDIAEYCNGTSIGCPADSLEIAGFPCRPAVSLCDIAEVCSGINATCPPDVVQVPGFTCRAANGSCDMASLCDGVSTVCPNHTYAVQGSVCRPINGSCDIAETCSGNSSMCPPDLFYGQAVACHPASDICDLTEYCTGTSPACPNDTFVSSTVACRVANLSCDVTEYCTGVSPSCPTDAFQPSTVLCRLQNGTCDTTDYCTGVSPACPPDSYATNGTVCRPPVAPCDATEYCNGSSFACPPDLLSSSSQICRQPVAACDTPDYCTGTSLNCPSLDILANSSVVCRPSAGPCDIAEKCNGTSPDCPADSFLDSADLCLPALGQCGQAQYCNGTGPSCPDRVYEACTGGLCDTKSGACVCANNRTIYPTCKAFCGDSTCNQNGEETCVNCPIDCVAPCNLCGDGVCSAQLGESCDSCFQDCYLQDCPTRQCNQPCVNGQCSNGICDCYGAYFGPTCAYKALQVLVSSGGSYPSVVVTVTTPTTGVKQRFSIALVEIAEEDPYGNLVRSIDVSNTLFTTDYTSSSTLQSWTFTTNITGYGQIAVYFTYALSSLTRSVSAAQTANTLTMEVDLSAWAFQSAQNSLQIICENSIVAEDIEACSVETDSYQGSLDWFLLHSSNVSLYYELAQTAVLDGYITRFLSNTLVTGANTVSQIPFFWYNMSLTTTFGFLPDPNYIGCNPVIPPGSGGGTKWEVYLSIPFVIIFVVIVLIVVMFVLRPARCFRQRRRRSIDTKHPMVGAGSEMVILPPSPPPQGQEPPPPSWQGDPRASTSNLPLDPRDSAAFHPVGHMSMQFPPPPNHTYRPAHASSPYPDYHHANDHRPHPSDLPAPSAPLPSPEPNKNYMNDQ